MRQAPSARRLFPGGRRARVGALARPRLGLGRYPLGRILLEARLEAVGQRRLGAADHLLLVALAHQVLDEAGDHVGRREEGDAAVLGDAAAREALDKVLLRQADIAVGDGRDERGLGLWLGEPRLEDRAVMLEGHLAKEEALVEDGEPLGEAHRVAPLAQVLPHRDQHLRVARDNLLHVGLQHHALDKLGRVVAPAVSEHRVDERRAEAARQRRAVVGDAVAVVVVVRVGRVRGRRANEAVLRVGAVEGNRDEHRDKLVQLEHGVARGGVGLPKLAGDLLHAVLARRDVRLQHKVVELFEVHCVSAGRVGARASRVRGEDGAQLGPVAHQQVVHAALPQWEARQLLQVDAHPARGEALVAAALGRHEARRVDVRVPREHLFLVRQPQDVLADALDGVGGAHRLDRAVLVDAAARDALEQLLKVERRVVERAAVAAAVALRVHKLRLDLRHRQPALEDGSRAQVARDVGAARGCECADLPERLHLRHPLLGAHLAFAHVRVGGEGREPRLEPLAVAADDGLHVVARVDSLAERLGVVAQRVGQHHLLQPRLERLRHRRERQVEVLELLAKLGVEPPPAHAHERIEELAEAQLLVGLRAGDPLARRLVGLVELLPHVLKLVPLGLEAHVDRKILELLHVHRRRARGRRVVAHRLGVRAEDRAELIVRRLQQVVHLALPQREAIEAVQVERGPFVEPHLLLLRVPPLERRRLVLVVVALRLDVCALLHDVLDLALLDEILEEGAHLGRGLHLLHRRELGAAEARDHLLELLKVDDEALRLRAARGRALDRLRCLQLVGPLRVHERALALRDREAQPQRAFGRVVSRDLRKLRHLPVAHQVEPVDDLHPLVVAELRVGHLLVRVVRHLGVVPLAQLGLPPA
mmetsp:Transcript_15235/g.45714  ORF Transcript_15235/g.45714 Transcript_15235/m.45714 type:complete len:877 (-) Transcript_15235:396-3026(-)